jgi:hypothetical protein
MSLAMSPAATGIGSLGDILVGTSGTLAQDPAVDALAGFDVVAQFSHGLLNLQVVRSLAQHGVASLRAYVPWGTVALPASLLAAIPPRLRLTLSTIPARLEVRLAQPYLAALRWPPDISVGDGGTTTTAIARRARGIRRRTADVGWRVEINVLTQRLDVGVRARSTPPAITLPADTVATTGVTTGDSPPSGDDGSWERLTLAAGQAIIAAAVAPDVPSGLWRFGMILDFADTTASVASDPEGVIEFLQGAAGKALLAQALAPLKAAHGVRLSPPIAPAGALAQAAVARANLPAFTVSDRLLTDQRGNVVLSLCAQLAGSSGGVARLVQVLLSGQDFAYAASEAVLRHAYQVCWTVVASGVSFVGETPVELPVGDDPNVTETGRAQLLTSFATTLDDVSLKATTAGHSDAVRLLVKQHVQLLNLWDHSGKRITNLGDLAKPVEEPTILPITLFERSGGTPDQMHPNFRDLMVKLLAIQVLPTLEPFPAHMPGVSGHCSAAMKTLLVRWRLRTWRDDVVAPTSGTVMGAA